MREKREKEEEGKETLAAVHWGLCEYGIAYTKLALSPVILWTELDEKPI